MIQDTTKKYCIELLNLLESNQVKDIVLSPGSRNTPLIIAAEVRESFMKYIVADERDAAFIALGMSMVSKKPVALCCTSGTALYNYAPGIAEAYYQKIPIIVVSADRPMEWIDQNDSQTLIQPCALDKIVKGSYNIPAKANSIDTDWFVNRVLNEAILTATDSPAGPVHINMQLDNPLGETVSNEAVNNSRVIRRIKPVPRFENNDYNNIINHLKDKKIMVIAGYMSPDNELNRYLGEFSSLPNVILLSETVSNLHIKGNPYAIDNILAGLSAEKMEILKPDIIISIGGALISKSLKNYVRNLTNVDIWTLGDTDISIDSFKNLSLHIEIPPAIFFKAVVSRLKRLTATGINYRNIWMKIKKDVLFAKNEFVNKIGWCELKAFRFILNNLPSNLNLFLSNGTPVRYAQLFTENIPHSSYSNRGVSGIEGTTATAIGCAIKYKEPTLLITGDLSFSYSVGLLGLNCVPDRFKIILINNKGGGIFRLIPTTRNIPCREKYFCVDPRIPVKELAKAYRWNYFLIENENDLNNNYLEFISSSNKSIMEIRVDEQYSSQVFSQYFSYK